MALAKMLGSRLQGAQSMWPAMSRLSNSVVRSSNPAVRASGRKPRSGARVAIYSSSSTMSLLSLCVTRESLADSRCHHSRYAFGVLVGPPPYPPYGPHSPGGVERSMTPSSRSLWPPAGGCSHLTYENSSLLWPFRSIPADSGQFPAIVSPGCLARALLSSQRVLQRRTERLKQPGQRTGRSIAVSTPREWSFPHQKELEKHNAQERGRERR
jgi:hypothetical protein